MLRRLNRVFVILFNKLLELFSVEGLFIVLFIYFATVLPLFSFTAIVSQSLR